MNAAARIASIERRESFPLATHRLEVLRAERAVQLVLVVDGFKDGPQRVANLFAGPETADELQVVVDYLRGLTWAT